MAVHAARPAIHCREPPGANGNLATEGIVNASADGHSLLMIAPANTINATLFDNLSFRFIRDIAPVAGMLRTFYVMVVNPSFPAKTVPEFIAYAKANRGKISYASAGAGTPQHVSAELFKMLTGVEMQHVPYRGSMPGAHRSHRRAGAGHVRQHGDGARARAGPAGCARSASRPRRAPRPCRTCRPSASSCRASTSAPSSASARRATRRPRSSKRSTARSMPVSPIPRSRRGSISSTGS